MALEINPDSDKGRIYARPNACAKTSLVSGLQN